ncbi:hypothetical protein RIF29_30811 [Crotalaria pallida]|uniref:Uncharacterized protein n=1 Tax=Crotalaria pallida TaxID=3830 RepID=A0AAN9ENH4_CROPI
MIILHLLATAFSFLLSNVTFFFVTVHPELLVCRFLDREKLERKKIGEKKMYELWNFFHLDMVKKVEARNKNDWGLKNKFFDLESGLYVVNLQVKKLPQQLGLLPVDKYAMLSVVKILNNANRYQ